MQIEYIYQNISSEVMYASMLLVTGIVLTFLVVFLRKESEEFRKKIMNEKRTKKRILDEVKKDLFDIKDHLNKLVNQKEVVGTFNSDTIHAALRYIKSAEEKLPQLKHIENTQVQEHIAGYIAHHKRILDEIKTIEQENYEYQRSYQELVLFYNREYAKYSSAENDPEVNRLLQQQVNKELIEKRNEVLTKMEKNNTLRNKYYHALQGSNDMHLATVNVITKYVEDNIVSKKFYIKQFSYV